MKKHDSIRDEWQQLVANMEDTFLRSISGFEPLWLESEEDKEFLEDYRNPVVEVETKKKEIDLHVELPGIDKDHIRVHATPHGIEVIGESSTEEKTSKKNTETIEKHYKGFYRYISLPEDAYGTEATSSYKNGVLEIIIPRHKSHHEKKQIPVA